MKKKKILGSIFASLFAITSIGALASCGDKKPAEEDPSKNPGESDAEIKLQKVEAALNALTVSGTKNENFTLPTTGAGDVTISWASDKPEVVAISGGDFTVKRPGFGKENVTVKLTATAVTGEVSKKKDFTITVEAIKDESKTVEDIKALAKDTITYAHGVVSGFLWGLDKSNVEEKKGFYLTDATGTIYVFGTQTAAQVNVGDEVYFEGKKDEYNSVAQIASPDKLTKLNEGQTPDFTTIIKDKTVKEIAASSENIGGNVYEFVAKVSQNTYGAYSLDDLAGYEEGTLSVYFSGSSSKSLVNYGAELKNKINQIVKVRFVVNSQNSSKKWRGNVLELVSFNVEEQKTYAGDAAKGLIDLNSQITQSTEVTLPTTMEGFDKVSIAWGFKEDTQAATIVDNKLTITPTSEPQSFVLTATITIEGVDDPIVVEYDQVDVCTSFEPMDYATYMDVENKKYIKVKGYVNILSAKDTFITDEDGNGYYLYGAVSDVELGDEIIVTGTKSIYQNLHEIAAGFIVEKTGNTKTITPVDVTEDIEANGFTVTTENQNKYVTFEGILTAAKEVTIGENKVSLFYKANVVEPEIGTTVKVTGIYSVYKTDSQIQVWSADDLVDQSTDAEKVEKVVLAIKKLFKEENQTYVSDTIVSLAKLPYDCTLNVAVEGSTLAYDEDTKIVTITPSDSQTAHTLTITVTIGEETSDEFIITVNALLDSNPKVEKVVATFNLGTDKEEGASHADGSENNTYSETSGEYTLTLANSSKVYHNANDAKGNACLKLGTGSVAATLSFTVAEDVDYVIIYVAAYKKNAAKIVINDGEEQTISTQSDEGEYTAIKVDTSNSKTVTLVTQTGGYRCMIDKIEFGILQEEENSTTPVDTPVVDNNENE